MNKSKFLPGKIGRLLNSEQVYWVNEKIPGYFWLKMKHTICVQKEIFDQELANLINDLSLFYKQFYNPIIEISGLKTEPTAFLRSPKESRFFTVKLTELDYE